ncbi:hypothetical protein H920_07285 [Fukomys damarensis]|uniref:Uncharacterized protein n=1 Tax=Fukomys damarensis TaxID=885580 RepID=A0A091DGN8_FUKDA|nr:hypothetical protein H920_07285 [Fukomys damarensis]
MITGKVKRKTTLANQTTLRGNHTKDGSRHRSPSRGTRSATQAAPRRHAAPSAPLYYLLHFHQHPALKVSSPLKGDENATFSIHTWNRASPPSVCSVRVSEAVFIIKIILGSSSRGPTCCLAAGSYREVSQGPRIGNGSTSPFISEIPQPQSFSFTITNTEFSLGSSGFEHTMSTYNNTVTTDKHKNTTSAATITMTTTVTTVTITTSTTTNNNTNTINIHHPPLVVDTEGTWSRKLKEAKQ